MKAKKIFLIAALALAAVVMSGCGPIVASNYPSVATDGSTVYLADGILYAIAADSGKQAWQFPEKRDQKKEIFVAPVLIAEDQLIAPSSGTDYTIYGIDPTRLDEKNIPAENWVFAGAKDRWIASPLLANDSLYAPNSDGTLYVLDLDGKLQWSLKVGGPLWTRPITDGRLIYLTSTDHFLYAVDPGTRAIAWRADLGGTSTGAPALTPDGDILAGSFDNRLLAFSPSRKGSVLWQQDTRGRIWASPVVVGNLVCVADLDGYVYFFDTGTGRPLRESVQPGGAIIAAPFAWDDLLVILTETGSVVAYDREGKIIWQRESGAKLYGTPTAAGDLLFVPTLESESLLIAYDRDGKQAWAFKPEK